MSRDAELRKAYEAGVVSDSLARLAARLDSKSLPFSEEELKTLAKRFRESFWSRGRKRERLDRYKAHLSTLYGAEVVAAVSAALEKINNEIGYEEK